MDDHLLPIVFHLDLHTLCQWEVVLILCSHFYVLVVTFVADLYVEGAGFGAGLDVDNRVLKWAPLDDLLILKQGKNIVLHEAEDLPWCIVASHPLPVCAFDFGCFVGPDVFLFEKFGIEGVEQFQVVVVGVDANLVPIVDGDVAEVDLLDGVVDEDAAVGDGHQQILDECDLHYFQVGVDWGDGLVVFEVIEDGQTALAQDSYPGCILEMAQLITGFLGPEDSQVGQLHQVCCLSWWSEQVFAIDV